MQMQMQNNNSYLSIIESPAMRIYPNVALCDRGMRQNFANERYRRYPQRNLWAGKKERVVNPIQKIHAATGCARTELPAKRTSATNVIARNSWKPTRFSGGRMSHSYLTSVPKVEAAEQAGMLDQGTTEALKAAVRALDKNADVK